MKNLLKIISIVLITTVLACSKDNDSPPPIIPKVETVYVGGLIENDNGNKIPTIWTDGVAQSLSITAGFNGQINAVFVDGNDVYAVGYEYPNTSINDARAILWKNRVRIKLSTIASVANAIYVSNGIPYIVGIEGNIATLWHTSTYISLQISTNGTSANGVSVEGNDIYIVGTNVQGATQWKNNGSLTAPSFTPTYLGSASSSAFGISVLDNNVYIVGRTLSNVTNTITAQLWKNNFSTQQFADNTLMFSVFAQGQDVFAAGSTISTPYKAMIWKNNQPTQLSQNDSFGYSVYATTTNNYVAGYEKNSNPKACIWKNGEIKILSDNLSVATSVFVTEK